jgi:hypothetical protein
MKSLWDRALLCAIVLAGFPPGARGLTYVESSTGLIPPTLDGGRTEVEFADLNQDGLLDLVSLGDHGNPGFGSDQHGLLVWFGDGTGQWSSFMFGEFGYGGIAIGDVNRDGLPDAAYGMHHNYADGDLGDQLIEAALGDGTGRSWTPWDDGLATAGEDYGMFGTDLADIDNDGDLDLASASFGCCAGVHVYENHGDGTWSHAWGFLGGNCGSDIRFGDVNADGFADFVVAHDAGTVYLGDGQGSFTNADGNLPPGGTLGRTGPSLGDIDQDGDLDIAYRGSTGALQVWRFEGPGTWISAGAGLPASGIAATQLADFDQDGHCDVAALGTSMIRVWLGDGGGTWSLAATIPLPSPASYAAFRAGGDVDHNGRPEIAVIDDEGSFPNDRNRFHVFREATPAAGRIARVLRPRGGERFVAGSAQFFDWITEVPAGETARIDLDLSTTGPAGPWIPLALDLPDAGRHQLIVPVAPTDEAYLRVRARMGGESVEAVSPDAFTILPPTAAGVDGADPVARATTLAWPNPFRASVTLSIPGGGEGVTVFDARGRRIRDGIGATWDGRDAAGRPVAPGVYLVRGAGGVARLVRLP